MIGEYEMITLPELSDEAAYELAAFFKNVSLELKSHYWHHLKRHSKALEKEYQSRWMEAFRSSFEK
ncbi:MAG TPA: hypothetical protein VNK03_01680 [Gammaproteobacteria bacterium]|nr:hypothetical protein [Gammaproteobacteria bacterium]